MNHYVGALRTVYLGVEGRCDCFQPDWMRGVMGVTICRAVAPYSPPRPPTLYELYTSNPQARGAIVVAWSIPNSKPHCSKMSTTASTTARIAEAVCISRRGDAHGSLRAQEDCGGFATRTDPTAVEWFTFAGQPSALCCVGTYAQTKAKPVGADRQSSSGRRSCVLEIRERAVQFQNRIHLRP
jgi:hypothetical protein